MKLAEKLNLVSSWPRNRKGIALLTVLTVMALTTILVLTFFSLASSEHQASNVYSNGLQAQQVAEQAVNMVIAQIREATTAGSDRAWASQPGAIRVWDETGELEWIYKLYSDDLMKSPDVIEVGTDFDDLGGWSSLPSHFVDLNEPVIRGEKVYYPIVHPAAANTPDWPRPLGDDQDGIEGFSYNKYPNMSLDDTGAFGAKAALIAGASDGHVAMPVQWIYQLADGTLGVLARTAGGSATEEYNFQKISGEGEPSSKNPMVARFAFWADDETSKLNLNVHAGGLAWDIPKAGGEMDMNMAKYQPAQHEWQRYPGHPATTHLIPALAPGVLDIVNDRDAMEMLFKVVPRVVGGGSESGTRVLNTRDPKESNGLIADKEPLFPSLDDMIMRSDREPHEFPDAKGRPIPEDQLSEYLERSKFFITVTSRAPETNMFNLPRVAIWPISNIDYGGDEYEEGLTPFDRLIHYCSSMGASAGGDYPRWEYIFKRENADSTSFDYDQISRNKDLYAYLLDLMGRQIPGYGESFEGKYGNTGAKQILTQIFDYIRSTNLHDDSIYREDFERAFKVDNTTQDVLTYTNPRQERNKTLGHKGHGQVVPIRIDETKGFGRFYTVSGVQIQVISCAEPGDFAMPAHMGATSYRGRNDIPPANPSSLNEAIFSNFPPHPANFKRGMQNYEQHEPLWLKTLRENNPQMYEAAFDPSNWNWQLAYLDPEYYARVVGSMSNPDAPEGSDSPSTGPVGPEYAKFNRRALTPSSASKTGAFSAGETRLKDNEHLVQAVMLFNMFTPAIGWGSINPDMEIELSIGDQSQMRFTSIGTGEPLPAWGVPFIGFEASSDDKSWIFSTNLVDSAWGGRRYGGTMTYEYLLNVHRGVTNRVYNEIHQISRGLPGYDAPYENYNYDGVYDSKMAGKDTSLLGGVSRFTRLDRGYNLIEDALPDGVPASAAHSYRYDLVTVPFKVDGASVDKTKNTFFPGEIDFKGGDLTFRFYHGGELAEASYSYDGANQGGVDGGELIQEVEIEIPNFRFAGQGNPNPRERRPVMWDNTVFQETIRLDNGGHFNEFDSLAGDAFSFLERNSLGADPGNPIASAKTKLSPQNAGGNNSKPHAVGRFAQISVHDRPSPFAITDIVQSVEIKHGDARLVAARPEIAAGEIFEAHRYYGDQTMAHSVTNSVGNDYRGASIEDDYLIRSDLPKIGNHDPYRNRAPLPFGGGENGGSKSENVQLYGDFDNGSGIMIDGPYINKPDEGNTHSLKTKYMQELVGYWEERRNYGEFPWFNREWRHESGGPAYFSPNRQVSGPGMFGSLPSRPLDDRPWETLLFRPATNGTKAGFMSHPGDQDPPDHLIMDLFWMPIVEPYAISEPLSTAGKVNLNYEMAPFLHIERNTALRGVFRSEFMVCIPNQWHADYKHNSGRGRGYHWRDNPYGGQLQGKRLRTAIVEHKTLEEFRLRFDRGAEIFKSATEICEMHLVPQEVSERLGLGSKGSVGSYTPDVVAMESGEYWEDHSLVGDNSRERPYTNIHNRVTTKSNTFQVHYRAQVIKQARRDDDADYGVWRPEFDTVQAEYRGSSIVERYVNPNDQDIPDLAGGSLDTLDDFYRFRIVNPRRFAP